MTELRILLVELIYDAWWCCRTVKGLALRGFGLVWIVCQGLTGLSMFIGWLAYWCEVMDNRLRIKSVLVLDSRPNIEKAEQRRLLGLRKEYRDALIAKADKQAPLIDMAEKALTDQRQRSMDFHRTEAGARADAT